MDLYTATPIKIPKRLYAIFYLFYLEFNYECKRDREFHYDVYTQLNIN